MGSLARKIARGLLRKRRSATTMAELFKRGEQGLWLDPSDLSTLLQDTAGTTPVTAPGQTVALAKDKSGRGNHLVQPVALSRPTLGRHPVGGTRNLLVGSEGQRGWTAFGTSPPTVSAVTHLGKPCWGVTFPAGLTNATWNVSRATYWSQIYPFPGAYSWRYKVATNRPLLPGETVLVLLNGSFATAGVNLTSADNLTQWADRGFPNIVSAASLNAGLYPAVTNVTTLGEPLTVYITDMQMEVGSTIAPYQRVTSQWDVTEEGKADCWYLGFDGVDDFMVSAAPVDMSASGMLSIFAGLRREKEINGSTAAFLVELGDLSTTARTFYVASPLSISGAGNAHGLGLRGPVDAYGLRQLVASTPVDYVVTHVVGAAASVRSRVNGALAVTATFADPGTFSPSQYLYIGARKGTSNFFKGRLYQLGIRGAESADAQVIPVEALIADKMGLPAPIITVTSGSGYAGSTLSADKAPVQWCANGTAIPGATNQQLTITLDLEGSDITYKWLGISSAPFRMWTPARAGITSVFDARRLSALSTDWRSADGVLRYVQPDAAKRPVYEADGLGGGPCMFSDWDKSWVIEGLSPAPGARTLMGLFAFITTDPANSYLQIVNTQPGAWTIRKSYPSGGKRRLGILRSPSSEVQESPVVFPDNDPCIVSLKTKRPSGEYGFRLNGASLGSGVSAGINAFVDSGGTYTMTGYIRLGSHAYVDSYMSPEDEADFEGWCAWTSGQQGLLAADHPRKAAPKRIS